MTGAGTPERLRELVEALALGSDASNLATYSGQHRWKRAVQGEVALWAAEAHSGGVDPQRVRSALKEAWDGFGDLERFALTTLEKIADAVCASIDGGASPEECRQRYREPPPETGAADDAGDYDIRKLPQYAKMYEHRKVWHRADRDARGLIDADDSAEDRPEPSTLKTGAYLLAEPEPEYDWLVPDLLERGDRAIITGSEGVGKTMLAAQLPVQASEGIHPITLRAIEPVRALLVDVEIGEREMRRRLRRYGGAGAGLENVVVECRGSLDLRRESHVTWLVETAQASRARVVWIGPLYRLASGDPIEETHARAVQSGLEALRELGIAVLLEAHCPHGMPDGGRPYGASAWKRWPEFGYCLRASGRYTPWRPPRDSERGWPEGWRRGGAGEWAWMAQAGQLAADAVEFHARVDDAVRIVRDYFEESGEAMPLRDLKTALGGRSEEHRQIINTAMDDGLIAETTGLRGAKFYQPVG